MAGPRRAGFRTQALDLDPQAGASPLAFKTKTRVIPAYLACQADRSGIGHRHVWPTEVPASVQALIPGAQRWVLPCQPSPADQSAPPAARFLWPVRGQAPCWPDPGSASTFREMPVTHGVSLWRRGPGSSETGFSGFRCALRCDCRTRGRNLSHFASRRRREGRSRSRLRRWLLN